MKSQRKMSSGGWILFVGILFLGISGNGAMGAEKPASRCIEVGGGEVPMPFDQLNRKVELASGENYFLVGKIIQDSGVYYLRINLDEHPWLATQYRRKSPYYPLADGQFAWSRYLNQEVAVAVKAHTVVSGGYFQVVLEPLSEPSRVRSRTKKKPTR